MSNIALTKVFTESSSKGAARLVLLAIANYANDEMQAWPGVACIARMAGVKERAVHYAIANLQAIGELNVGVRAGARCTNLYTITIQGVQTVQVGGANRAPNTSLHLIDTSMKEEKKKEVPSDEGLKFADWFKTLIPEINLSDNWKTKWAIVYDKLTRIDKRGKAEIAKVCQWARSDSFWSAQFLSPEKLRRRNNSGVQYYDVFKAKITSSSFPSVKKTEFIPGVGQMTQDQMAACRKKTEDAQNEYLKKYELI